jgi:hypothetical protein
MDIEFRVINLYKYEPQPGHAPIASNTRPFCSKLYVNSSGDKYYTYKEIQSMITPGKKYGVRDVLRYCGNYSIDPKYTSCRHRWVRYKYDTVTGNIIMDPSQPPYTSTTSKK